MKYTTKLMALALLGAMHAQASTKPCSCSQPKPPTTKTLRYSSLAKAPEDTQGDRDNLKPCPCSQPKPPKPQNKVLTEIAVGELVDKITILQIKSENITDPEKLKNIHTELATLQETLDQNVEKSPEIEKLTEELLAINRQLWDIEDDIRDKERAKEFDQEFIEIARSVYYTNDERCAVKRKINNLTGSRLQEEKSYSDYK